MRVLLFACLLAWSVPGWTDGPPADFAGWWLTPDQRGQRLFDQERFLEAAERFEDPARRGAAYYRGGDFERAAGTFGRLRTPDAAYNRGNALVLLGRYDEAIESYELALELQPGREDARENLAIAIARKAMLAPPEDDAGGTGGMLEADEIVFDDSGRTARSGTEAVSEGETAVSDEEMRAVWLRRVQSDPADFLSARFVWQLHRGNVEGDTDAATD
jgi:Ca-activated chloride channel family protein